MVALQVFMMIALIFLVSCLVVGWSWMVNWFVVFNGGVLFLVSGFVGFSLGFCCAFRWCFNWFGLDLRSELLVNFVNLIFRLNLCCMVVNFDC